MVNSEGIELLRDYAARITGQSDEANLIRAVPWVLGSPGDLAALLAGLRLEAGRLRELPQQITFSLVVPCSSHTQLEDLNNLILSVRCQSWFRWELLLADEGTVTADLFRLASRWAEVDERIQFLKPDRGQGSVAAKNTAIEASRGNFVSFLDDHALLHPCALGMFARQLNCANEINLIFSHEARLDLGSTRIRRYIRKPDFDLFTLLRTEYVGNLTAIRMDLLINAQEHGMVFRPEYEGVESHDLMIRLAAGECVQAMSLPFFLYYSTESMETGTSKNGKEAHVGKLTRDLIEDHLEHLYPGASWTIIPPSLKGANQYPGVHIRSIHGHVRHSLLVIIPFKDQSQTTLRCLDSIERQEHSLDVDIVLVNNLSCDARTLPLISSWLKEPRRHRYHLVDDDGAFNYARINNDAYKRFGRSKDLILFMNNDTEILSVDCFQTMAMQALSDAKCGAIGIRLLYPDDGTVQHGGIKICDNRLSVCGSHAVDHARNAEEYVNDERISFGVTFAVAMMRRDTFERLGMLEEVSFPNAYSDVAICAKAIQMGLKNYYFGTLLGLHYEMKTRGRACEDYDYLKVYQLYVPVFSHWMMRGMVYSDPCETNWSREARMTSGFDTNPFHNTMDPTPLRYKVVDRMNAGLKALLGPVHPALKRGISRSNRLLASLKSMRAEKQVGRRETILAQTIQNGGALSRKTHLSSTKNKQEERSPQK